ncbi:hypothetical protein ACIRON_21805 [Nocardioides sp. NPDC101246]|uniref:hypothetical protein n=1 Tax=Nocardioides sp. NPDC101246 TaxID=3364336 RepID=UPI00380DCB65
MNGWEAEPGSRNAYNFAGDGSYVENQAQEIHQNHYYSSSPDDAPEERYKIGIRYLDSGSPRRAEELINEAINRGYDHAEVRFHWVLAMFSKRSFRDLNKVDRDQLQVAIGTFATIAGHDRYARALEPLGALIGHLLSGADGDAGAVEKQILGLDPDLFDKITHHLEWVLSGVAKQQLWKRTLERAKMTQFANDRSGRVWSYFEPDPTRPRLGALPKAHDPPEGHPSEVAGVGVFLIASLLLGWLALTSGNAVAVVAFPVLVAASVVAGRDAYKWCYRTDRVALTERRHYGNGLPIGRPADEKGFVATLRRSFEYNFAKYRPADKTAQEWLEETTGVRERLCGELAETYREQRTSVVRIRWLVRYHAIEAKESYRAGTFYDFGANSHIDWRAVVRFVGSVAAAVLAGVLLFRASNIGAQLVLLVAALTGSLAVVVGYRLYRARRDLHEDAEDAEEQFDRRKQAFEHWKQRLADWCPAEDEMETWLLSDITVLIDKALSEATMDWSDVISHAVIREPAPGSVRQREQGGPWRYSKYRLHIFLVTVDGVRNVVAELDFKKGIIGEQSRRNFQLDNITAIEVTEEVGGGRVLGVMLNNGEPSEIRVVDGTVPPKPVRSETLDDPYADDERTETTTSAEEDPESSELVRLNLDATGFDHALRLLEGIGADGKGWIERHASA